MKPIQCVTFALALSICGRAVQAQEKPSLDAALDPQAELVRLFGKVESRLKEIDRMLSDAGAGDTRALSNVGPAGIDELLKQGRSNSEEAVKDIDRILEIARQMSQQQQSSSSGSGQGQPQPGEGKGGKDPLGGQENNSTQRENTPSGPEKGGEKPQDEPGGSKPKDPNGKQPGQKPGEKPGENGDPKDPRASRSDPKNRAGGPPPQGGRDSASSPSDTRDRWGDLPVHARDVFRNEGGRDMPVQYRDWIDEYYRRLNKQGP